MPETVSRSEVEELVERVLGPILGASMARAATQGHCRGLGIDGETIDRKQLETLVGRLALGLKIFVGGERAEELAAEIRRAAGGPA